MTFKSALSEVFKGLVRTMQREKVTVGSTASYPRVEVHSIVENEPTDKGGSVRSISCIVESVSAKSYDEADVLNAGNIQALMDRKLDLAAQGFRCIGVVPGQVQEFTEVSETNAEIYRILFNLKVFAERTNK